jgi:hypothetical protein
VSLNTGWRTYYAPTTCRSSCEVCDYADFVTVGTATTSAFSLDIGIIRISA